MVPLRELEGLLRTLVAFDRLAKAERVQSAHAKPNGNG
jgi:hypothetical protein